MTHAIYSRSALEALSVAQVKAIANQVGAIPDGDKRIKQTWIDAVIAHQTAFSPAKIAAMEAHIETVMSRAMTEKELFEYEIGQHEAADGMEDNDTLEIEDIWVAPEMPISAEQEAIAHAADIAPKKAAKSLSALIERELGESALMQTAPEHIEFPDPAPAPEKVLNKSTPLGAALVVGAMVCAIILIFRTLLFGTCAIAQLGIYIVRLFGKYDPDLDLNWQFAQFRRQRLTLVPVQ